MRSLASGVLSWFLSSPTPDALGWWFAEAITLAVSTIGMFLLIPLSASSSAVGDEP